MRGDHLAAPAGLWAGAGPPPRARGPPGRGGTAAAHAGTTPACAGTTLFHASTSALTRDHPRVRGDHGNWQCNQCSRWGPPPRARGPLREGSWRQATPGTTPACAGTTVRASPHHLTAWDHPRVRGDHNSSAIHCTHQGGPPPRARGPRWAGPPMWPHAGTTPACAGTTIRSGAPSCGDRDHPRVRGDHRTEAISASDRPGPPPRARGPPAILTALRAEGGTTPACAGTTRGPAAACRPQGDHPRVRGDHRNTPATSAWAAGPPPRARGPPARGRPAAGGDGTTPACAGTTGQVLAPLAAVGDHPRVRGDHLPDRLQHLLALGPPPRARGPPGDHRRPVVGQGTTPACAGTTRIGTIWVPGMGDHPRVRGDHLHRHPLKEGLMGPPPRARGPRTRRCRRSGFRGTTPACAGTTNRSVVNA